MMSSTDFYRLLSIGPVQTVYRSFVFPFVRHRTLRNRHGHVVRSASKNMRHLLVSLAMNLNRVAHSQHGE
jgi:hypothetical protein